MRSYIRQAVLNDARRARNDNPQMLTSLTHIPIPAAHVKVEFEEQAQQEGFIVRRYRIPAYNATFDVQLPVKVSTVHRLAINSDEALVYATSQHLSFPPARWLAYVRSEDNWIAFYDSEFGRLRRYSAIKKLMEKKDRNNDEIMFASRKAIEHMLNYAINNNCGIKYLHYYHHYDVRGQAWNKKPSELCSRDRNWFDHFFVQMAKQSGVWLCEISPATNLDQFETCPVCASPMSQWNDNNERKCQMCSNWWHRDVFRASALLEYRCSRRY